jgi:putative ABC transport system permease protein
MPALRYAFRALRRDTAFSATVVLILAVGIGATTAIFSVVKAVLLDPLPYADAGRLVRVWESSPSRGVAESAVSVPTFEDWRRGQSSFDQLAASEMATFNLTGSGDPERLAAARITANLLPALGVSPVAGRTFRADDERPGAPRVALIGYALWQRRFGGDPSVVSSAIRLNDERYTVVGVLPPELDVPTARELWVPLIVDVAREPWRADRSNRNLAVYGRLRAGVPLATATADLDRLAAGLAASSPATNAGWGVRVSSFDEWLVPRPVRQATIVLFAAVGLLLLLTCANVANLLLARTVARHREIATHAALGASRSRLVRQLLLESGVLALAGGLAGALLARWSVSLINAGTIPEVPRLKHMAVDGVVLAFALGVSVVTGLLFGSLPAWWASRRGLASRIRDGGSTTGSRRTLRLRGTLVALQIALTVAVVASGALLVRSFVAMQRVPLGFSTSNVLTFQVNLPASTYATPEGRVGFYAAWFERLRAVPGVAGVGAATHPPFAPSDWKVDVTIAGVSGRPGDVAPAAVARAVTPGYFQALGIPLSRGRVFAGQVSPPGMVELVVSEGFARRFFPGEDPVGKSVRPAGHPPGTVVGVVGDARTSGVDETEPALYFSHADLGMPSLAVVVRTSGDPQRLVASVRHELRALDATLPIYNVRTVEEIVTRATARPRFQAVLVGTLGAAALALAAFGTFSMITYVVRQRRKEIAVRIALGASRADISRVLVREGMRYALPGVAAGLVASAGLAQALRTVLFRISPTDAVTFTLTPLAILGVAWLAIWWPASRAGRTAPVIALRND